MRCEKHSSLLRFENDPKADEKQTCSCDGRLKPAQEEAPGEEKGLVLWGEVSIDVTLRQLPQKKCSCCGQPASVSRYDLRRHERTVFCDSCGLW